VAGVAVAGAELTSLDPVLAAHAGAVRAGARDTPTPAALVALCAVLCGSTDIGHGLMSGNEFRSAAAGST